jgi:uncharacterized Zn-finger protein
MANKILSIKTANDPVANPEIIKVAKDTDQVACDGGHPSLGHPVVYYTFDGDQNYIECGYCDRRFVRKSK